MIQANAEPNKLNHLGDFTASPCVDIATSAHELFQKLHIWANACTLFRKRTSGESESTRRSSYPCEMVAGYEPATPSSSWITTKAPFVGSMAQAIVPTLGTSIFSNMIWPPSSLIFSIEPSRSSTQK